MTLDERGRGTFVEPTHLDRGPRELTSFTEETRRRGLGPASHVLETGAAAAEGWLAEVPAIAPATGVSVLKRLRLAYARETHFAAPLQHGHAQLLGVPLGVPGLAAERVTFLENGRPLEFVGSIMRGDRHHVVLDLVKDTRGSGRSTEAAGPHKE
jgi:GntR family transcriptional regulator